MATPEDIAQRLHDECCKGCNLSANAGWIEFGEAVAAGELTYERAVEVLLRGSYS